MGIGMGREPFQTYSILVQYFFHYMGEILQGVRKWNVPFESTPVGG